MVKGSEKEKGSGNLVNSIRHKLITGSAWATLGQFSTMLFGFIASIVLARLLTTQDMGTYFLAMSFIAVMTTVFSLGLPVTIVRKVSQYMGLEQTGLARRIILLCLFITFFLGLLAYGFVTMSGGWLAEHVFGTVALAVLMPQIGFIVFVALMRGFIAESFRGFHDYRSAVLFGGMTSSLLTTVAVLLLLWLKGSGDTEQVLWISLFSGSVALTLALFFMFSKIKHLKKQPDIKQDVNMKKEIFSMSWTMWFIGIVIFLIINADLWVVSALGSEEDVAIYAMASRLTIFVTLFHTISVAVIQPIISELHTKGDLVKLERVVRMVGTINFVAAFVACALLVFFAKDLLSFLYGDSYAPAESVLIVLGFAHLLGMIFGPLEMVLMMTGYQKSYLALAMITGGLGIALELLLMPLFGVIGVAYAMLIGGVVYSLMSWWLVHKKLEFKCHISLKYMVELFSKDGLIHEILLLGRSVGNET